MNIYQPMMFVGLGGTGCMVGAELERRLREELCGPDGRALTSRLQGYLPYQLPSCIQFVYADLNESELTRLRTAVVPSREHEVAVGRTQRLTRDLVPRFNTYQRVAQSLRTNARAQVRSWLPPTVGEPHIAPLVRGAGQLPTVGRAALFETFRHGLAPAEEPLTEAIGLISNSGDELARLGGSLSAECDVFVAFSVAGGTGAGIFYDYLFLIGDALARQGYAARIHPLVLMPSAFEEGMGGGRRARLNAAPALLDLLRLVDQQNGAAGPVNEETGASVGGVHYPGRNREIVLEPLTIQTAFLFSGSAAINRDDLHRSVSSFVLALVSTGNDASDGSGDRLNQSFADDFINQGVVRGTPSETGIGLRGVSTSLVASMSVPVDDLADIIAIRLLGRAVEELRTPARDNAEGNEHLIDSFLVAGNLDDLRTSRPLPFDNVEPTRGADAITAELAARGQMFENKVIALEDRLRRQMPELVNRFDPWRAVQALLGETDMFRLHRVLVGDRDIDDDLDRGGVVADLEARRQDPPRPSGITVGPPALADLRDRRFGVAKLRWADEVVQRILSDQERWYEWRSQSAWQASWADLATQWGQRVETLVHQVAGVVEAFTEHARDERDVFEARRAELYRPRSGVTYLLPAQRDLEGFYQEAVNRLIRQSAGHAQATEGDVLLRLLGAAGWRQAWEAALRDGPAAAVSVARERVKEEVKRLFVDTEAVGSGPLLPPMATLLAAAAGRGGGGGGRVAADEVRQFEAKIHGLIPQGFTPRGSGPLKVLISYPANAPDPSIANFLRQRILLPREPNMTVDFRAVPTESVSVTQLRTSMSITEVPEVRDVLRHWSEAVDDERPEDFLRWRQRIGYDFAWLATTAEDRVRIMHHFLCAIWNGQVTTRGNPDSPAQVRVRFGPESDAAFIVLTLRPIQGTSSWVNLPRAYEEWALEDDEQHRRDLCRLLMNTVPDGVRSAPSRPSDLFTRMIALADKQASRLEELRGPGGAGAWAAVPHIFWTQTVQGALRMQFDKVRQPARESLAALYDMVGPHRSDAEEPVGDHDFAVDDEIWDS